MKQLIKLTDINQEYRGEKILTNVNLTFYQFQNTVIYADDNHIDTCHLLLDIIAKHILPQKGTVEFFNDKSNKFFLGYNTFDEILEKDIIVINILKALSTNYEIPKVESEEMLKLLMIDQFLSKSVIELTPEEKQLLKTYLLLMIKPQIVILKSLSIPGTTLMQSAALEYIKNYLQTYHITLIISTNDKNTINILCQRGINLSNSVVESDVLIVQEAQVLSNEVNMQPKTYDFANDLLEKIYQMEEDKNAHNDARKNEKKFVESLITKSLKSHQPTPTQALDDELENIINEKRHQQEDIVNNANIQANIQANVTKTVRLMDYDQNIDIQQLIDIYHQRKQLQDEINSPEFVNLAVALQAKVYENLSRSNAIIIKYDPTGKHDPYYAPALDQSLNEERMNKPVNVKKVGITKMIFDENLDIDALDLDDNTHPLNKTKEIEVNNYEPIRTKSYNPDELTKKISTASDIEYMPKNEKKKFWSFNKKKNNDNKLVSSNYLSDAETYANPYSENLTQEFLNKAKREAPVRTVKTEKFEPTHKLIDVQAFDLEEMEINNNEKLSDAERKKKMIELKIKKRSKLNALEELFFEALEEKEQILKTKKFD